jgi:hypothetical protein
MQSSFLPLFKVQKKLYASRRSVVSGKFVILTGILQAAKIDKFNACQRKAWALCTSKERHH